jgi:hypothetical protein
MNETSFRIEDTVFQFLPASASSEIIRKTVETFAKQACTNEEINYSDIDIDGIIKRLEARIFVKMSEGVLIQSEDYRPWLDAARSDIDWYYSNRYKRYIGKTWAKNVLKTMDRITDNILDHLENPHKEDQWARKGMVVGYVQSGKTANYTELMSKAADCGYRVIIILAGTLNSLRNQTQSRLDKDFIGKSTVTKKTVGVGEIDSSRIPACFTTSAADFSQKVANQISVGIGDLKEPVLLVIKKHPKSIENLNDWLRNNNGSKLKDYPMLLIDDEADNASINTNPEGKDPTAINRLVRELIHLFGRSSYVGYTATPFANVFVDPDTTNEMLHDDIFPRDFIISLDPPDNYFGPLSIFTDTANQAIVKEIKDYDEVLPLKHPINTMPSHLPESLKDAIRSWVIARAIRKLREGKKVIDTSMLINVSRFTRVQTVIRNLVDDYFNRELLPSVVGNFKLPEKAALKNAELNELYLLFNTEFSNCGFSWGQVQENLKEAVSAVNIVEVNSSQKQPGINYSRDAYPEGRNVIAIGGMSLSRGLTLEGLSTSYFLRNSIMYDTLMQMGRWFGYRDGYDDLCRIYMTAEAKGWYEHITDVTEELRGDFKDMMKAGMTPKDFGLKVRCHPECLIVTARNKMRSAKIVVREISLIGRLAETSVLSIIPEIITKNRKALTKMIFDVDKHNNRHERIGNGYLWQNVPSQYVVNFLKSFANHPGSQITESEPLIDFVKWLDPPNDLAGWDVVLVSLHKEKEGSSLLKVGDFSVISEERKVSDFPGNGIILNKRRLASRGLEKVGLTEAQISKAENSYKASKNIPDRAYRQFRDRPLLMLHLLECTKEDKMVIEGGIAAFGISFPGVTNSIKPEILVKYIVNTIWWQKNYADFLDDEDETDI